MGLPIGELKDFLKNFNDEGMILSDTIVMGKVQHTGTRDRLDHRIILR